MKFNKKLIDLCNIQLVLFLLFLLVVAFHLDNLIHYDTTVAVLVRVILIGIALFWMFPDAGPERLCTEYDAERSNRCGRDP